MRFYSDNERSAARESRSGETTLPARLQPALFRNHSRGEAFKFGRENFTEPARYRFAFIGVAFFTLLLYLRPQELYPQYFTGFQVVKIVAAATVAIYLLSRLHWREKLTILPLELKMVLTIYILGWVMLPFAWKPDYSLATLTDSFLKVIIIFIMMINVITTRRRLLIFMKLIVMCGCVLAVGAIKHYLEGNFSLRGVRIEGIVGGIFGNPNDLATSLDLIIPLAIVLAMTQRGVWRFLSMLSVPVLVLGVIVTFSRSGFIALALGVGFFIWKLGEKKRGRMILASVAVMVVLLMAAPGSYRARLSTIFDVESDRTGSAQERQEILRRAVWLAVRRPVIGVGISNFGAYSIREMLAHNSYLEISAELGLAGLIAYLVLIFAPLRSCRRIERETRAGPDVGWDGRDPVAFRRREMYLLSIGLQAVFLVYIVCNFFASIQYLWFLYYPVAYVVALRVIRQREEATEAVPVAPAPEKIPLRQKTVGRLWKAAKPKQEKVAAGALWNRAVTRTHGKLFTGSSTN